MGPIVSVIAVAFSVVIASLVFGRRASDLGQPAMHLDRNCIEGRILWFSDAIAITALLASTIVASAHIESAGIRSWAMLIVALVLLSSVTFLIRLSRQGLGDINAYPASFYDDLPPRVEKRVEGLRGLPPGLGLSVVGQAALLITVLLQT